LPQASADDDEQVVIPEWSSVGLRNSDSNNLRRLLKCAIAFSQFIYSTCAAHNSQRATNWGIAMGMIRIVAIASAGTTRPVQSFDSP